MTGTAKMPSYVPQESGLLPEPEYSLCLPPESEGVLFTHKVQTSALMTALEFVKVLPGQLFHALWRCHRHTKHEVSFILLFLAIVARETLAAKKPLLRDGLFDGYKFTSVREFTDEFRGSFNHHKWHDVSPRWKGRQPGLFASKNVKQKGGQLHLKGVYENPGSSAFQEAPPEYHTYTTAFVQSKKNVKYGYFEVKAKPGNSRLSSSFWASLDTPQLWTEIDVFEIGGGAENRRKDEEDHRKVINTNIHVFRDMSRGIRPGKTEVSKPYRYTHSSFLRSRFNTYGLDWSKKYITWTFNGRAIRRHRNRMWTQAMPIKFDVETMGHWFGLPSRETLPATFKLKYIRAWKRRRTRWSKPLKRSIRNDLSAPTKRQLGDMFGLGVGLPGTSDGSEDEDENDEDDGEDSAETEVFLQTEPETDVRPDGLQRAPIPGSNEVVYQPVVPTQGRNWSDVIAQQNLALDDVYGARMAPDETIDVSDFDEELVLFPPVGRRAPAGSPNDGPTSGSTSQRVSTSGSESSETANDFKSPQSWFDGFFPTFPWS